MRFSLWFALLLCVGSIGAEEPWGRDAGLCCRPRVTESSAGVGGPFVSFGRTMIRFHQEVLSPTDGPRSHYYPSSSQYTLDAMEKYGFFYGFLLGCDRLMRENNDPWVYRSTVGRYRLETKYDPVR